MNWLVWFSLGQIKPENSLFRYPRGKGPTDFAQKSFEPIFWSPGDDINGTVVDVCGNDLQCQFDLAVTGNEDIARATRGAVASYKTAAKSATTGRES